MSSDDDDFREVKVTRPEVRNQRQNIKSVKTKLIGKKQNKAVKLKNQLLQKLDAVEEPKSSTGPQLQLNKEVNVVIDCEDFKGTTHFLRRKDLDVKSLVSRKQGFLAQSNHLRRPIH